MPRLMSVTLTEQAVVERRKTVTRRLGWAHLKPGDELDLCRKVMGRKRADGTVEPLVRLARVRVLFTGWEPLNTITDTDVVREGFTPDDWAWNPAFPLREKVRWFGSPGGWFVRFFCDSMRCPPEILVNRIEWEYLT